MLTEQFLSRFIDGVVRARLVIHNDCHSLNLPEILRVNMQSWKGFSARDTSVGVTSLYSCQACQADCLPFPTKAEVVSQPLSAWNTGRQRALVSPRETHTLLTLMKWKCFPIPKGIQMSASDLSVISRSNFPTRITTTSVSTVRIRTLVQPDCRACSTWITILVSASSWLHGGLGVAADPHDVTDCPERAKVRTEHRYQNNILLCRNAHTYQM